MLFDQLHFVVTIKYMCVYLVVSCDIQEMSYAHRIMSISHIIKFDFKFIRVFDFDDLLFQI